MPFLTVSEALNLIFGTIGQFHKAEIFKKNQIPEPINRKISNFCTSWMSKFDFT